MIRLRTLLLVLAGLAAAGLVVFWGGFVHIGASTGHWAATEVVLHTAMRRSVKFHARNAEPPPDWGDPALVRRGAGHYETGCAPCHGSPATPRGPAPRAMTPHPPPLAPRVAGWEPKHLFWIVKHGVKFSGMPAWAARERDDEPWALAAFLLELPEMDAAAYRRLAYGDAIDGAPGALSLAADPPLADCVRCHGREGLGTPDGAFPRLDIQSEAYLLAALRAYHAGHRESGIMQSAVAPLEEGELVRLARHYARGRPAATAALAPEAVPAEVLAQGERIAREGLPEEDVAACLGCHGADGSLGRPEFPRLHGQYPNYLALQLRLFASGTRRGGTPFASLMEHAAHALDEPDIEAVAAWFASRDPAVPVSARGGAPGTSGRTP